MRDAHDSSQAPLNLGDIRVSVQPHKDPAVNAPDIRVFRAFEREPDIADEPVLKEGSVLAFQPYLAVVNDEYLLHVCSTIRGASFG